MPSLDNEISISFHNLAMECSHQFQITRYNLHNRLSAFENLQYAMEALYAYKFLIATAFEYGFEPQTINRSEILAYVANTGKGLRELWNSWEENNNFVCITHTPFAAELAHFIASNVYPDRARSQTCHQNLTWWLNSTIHGSKILDFWFDDVDRYDF